MVTMSTMTITVFAPICRAEDEILCVFCCKSQKCFARNASQVRGVLAHFFAKEPDSSRIYRGIYYARTRGRRGALFPDYESVYPVCGACTACPARRKLGGVIRKDTSVKTDYEKIYDYENLYMDDMILIHNDREYLRECLRQMEEYAERNLKLEFNEKTQIHHISQGVDYLGFHFYLTDTGKVIRKLRQSGKKRLKKKMAALKRLRKDGRIDDEAVKRCLISYDGHLSHGNTGELRRKLKEEFKDIIKERYENEEKST